MGLTRSEADPCLYIKHDVKHGLIMIISWIDDLLVVGSEKGVEETKKALHERFDCDDIGTLTEYIGCKLEVDLNKRRMK